MKYIHLYFPDIDYNKLEKLQHFSNFLTNWNSKINLISRKDISNIELHHIIHSLAVLKFFEFPKGTNIIDVGTGGGFPGVPLAIMLPEVNFVLIDSIKKKVEALKNIVSNLKLNNCEVFCIRSENIHEKFDFVMGRAVSNLNDFIKSTKHLIKEKKINENLNPGIIYLKGGELENELKTIKANLKIFSIYDVIKEEFFYGKYILYLTF